MQYETEGRGTLLRPKENTFLFGPTLTVNNVNVFIFLHVPNYIIGHSLLSMVDKLLKNLGLRTRKN